MSDAAQGVDSNMSENDLHDDEDHRVVLIANAIRQARQGVPFDPWEWDFATHDDVDRARKLLDALETETSEPE